jgi:trk system potassium uptake protein TrkA
MIKSKKRYIIIIGCGRLGSHLANNLSKADQSVVMIDLEKEAFNRLNDEYSGFNIEADATEIDVLEKAKIKDADVLVATTNRDNTNIMIAQIAKQIYGVENVIARLSEPRREKIYKELQIETICPTILSSVEFERIIISKEEDN